MAEEFVLDDVVEHFDEGHEMESDLLREDKGDIMLNSDGVEVKHEGESDLLREDKGDIMVNSDGVEVKHEGESDLLR